MRYIDADELLDLWDELVLRRQAWANWVRCRRLRPTAADESGDTRFETAQSPMTGVDCRTDCRAPGANAHR